MSAKDTKRDSRGKFKRGHAGLKPKGARAAITEKTRDLIAKIYHEKLADLDEDLEKMKPSEKWSILNNMAKYAIAPLSSIELKTDGANKIALVQVVTSGKHLQESETKHLDQNNSDE